MKAAKAEHVNDAITERNPIKHGNAKEGH